MFRPESRTNISKKRLGPALLVETPAFPRGAAGNSAPPLRRQRDGAGGPAFQAAQPAERSRMRIGGGCVPVLREHGDSLGRSVTAGAGHADRLDALRLVALIDLFADEATAADGEDRVLPHA